MRQRQAYSEVVEGDAGVVGKQRAKLMQACQHHKGAAVVFCSQSYNMRANRRHNASIGQHHMCAHQHLHHALSSAELYYANIVQMSAAISCACKKPGLRAWFSNNRRSAVTET